VYNVFQREHNFSVAVTIIIRNRAVAEKAIILITSQVWNYLVTIIRTLHTNTQKVFFLRKMFLSEKEKIFIIKVNNTLESMKIVTNNYLGLRLHRLFICRK